MKNNGSIDNSIKKKIRIINKDIKIYNTQYKIVNIDKFDLTSNYLIFSGIGNPKSFKKTLLQNKFKIFDEIIFPDHFNYDKNDIEKIRLRAKKNNLKIITTEKDFLKISKIDNDMIDFVEIDLTIENKPDLINFLKDKINA